MRPYFPFATSNILTSLLAVLALATGAEGELSVAVSVLPEVGLVERIGGERVTVRTVVRPGESPATFQPSDRQVSEILSSDLYFCLGMPFEAGSWFQAVKRRGGPRLVDLRHGMEMIGPTASATFGECEYRPGTDPHVWLSIRRLRQMAKTLAGVLTEHDEEGAEVFAQNLDHLLADLDTLAKTARGSLDGRRARPFFVFHPTWTYLASDFGLEQVAVEDHGSMPSDRELAEIRELFQESGETFLLVQPQVAGRAAASSARILGAELREIDSLSRDPLEAIRAFATLWEEEKP